MIHLLCALKPEAKPLISHFALAHHPPGRLFPTYINRDRTVSLTISGPGKTAAATAALHTYMLFACSKTDIWLNTGIAGHATFSPGQAVLANRIEDSSSGLCWYPQILFKTAIPCTTVLTLDKPSSDYREDTLFDMEAAGFYEAVSRFAIAELCHSLKIISDNETHQHRHINAARVASHMADNLGNIESVIKSLSNLSSELILAAGPHNEEHEVLLKTWHFTQSQRIRLQALLKRWRVLYPDTSLLTDDVRSAGNSREVLKKLSARLDIAPVRFQRGVAG